MGLEDARSKVDGNSLQEASSMSCGGARIEPGILLGYGKRGSLACWWSQGRLHRPCRAKTRPGWVCRSTKAWLFDWS